MPNRLFYRVERKSDVCIDESRTRRLDRGAAVNFRKIDGFAVINLTIRFYVYHFLVYAKR